MKVYRAILQQACLIDYWLIVTNVSIQLIFVTFDGHNIFLCIGLLSWLKYPYSSYVIAVWFYSFHLAINANCVPFIYRYLILCRRYTISTLQYLEGSFFSPDNIFMLVKADSGKWAITCGYLMLLQFLAYSIVITCGIKIKRYVKNSNIGEPGSKRMDQVNKELSIILFFQTVLPLAEFSLSAVCVHLFNTSDTLDASYKSLDYYFCSENYRNFIRPSKKVVSTTTTNSVTGY
uniref:7TM GPCR serpentine receptor class x (Srx) domain-containing protein n=1 Tax=Ditylenchus dipsaci TaxID=166011 RepID=A0A915EKQ6_9BILA